MAIFDFISNHELVIHPWRTPDRLDPSRLGEATDRRHQRFIAVFVCGSDPLSPASLCVTRITGWSRTMVIPCGCSSDGESLMDGTLLWILHSCAWVSSG